VTPVTVCLSAASVFIYKLASFYIIHQIITTVM